MRHRKNKIFTFFQFFIVFWPLYTAVTWWLIDQRTFDAYLARLARLGVLMGSAGLITNFVLSGWDFLKDYNFV